MVKLNFQNRFYHILPIVSPIKYNLKTLLTTYSKTLAETVFKRNSLSSAKRQVRLAQFITFSRAAQMIMLYLLSDLPLSTRLLNFDFNYLSGFPAGNRLVFAGVIILGSYILEQLYFRFEALKLVKLVSLVVLKKDQSNYLLEKKVEKRRKKSANVLKETSQKIRYSIELVVYAFQFLYIIGGKNCKFLKSLSRTNFIPKISFVDHTARVRFSRCLPSECWLLQY